MIRIPDYKIREFFLLLGASETDVDKLVTTYQTRHIQPLPVEARIEYFNFMGYEDSWERIIHTIRGDDVHAIIDFLQTQLPDSLVYKRCVEKLCHYIFAPDWIEKLGEMWHKHSLHTHNPKDEWSKAIDYSRRKDNSGRLEEDLVDQVFAMKEETPLILEIRTQYSGQEKPSGRGCWRPLNLMENYVMSQSAVDALGCWTAQRKGLTEKALLDAAVMEFEVFIKSLKRAAASAEDIRVIFTSIEHFEAEEQYALPELKTGVRRYCFEKLIEPYRNRQYQ